MLIDLLTFKLVAGLYWDKMFWWFNLLKMVKCDGTMFAIRDSFFFSKKKKWAEDIRNWVVIDFDRQQSFIPGTFCNFLHCWLI